MVSFDAATSLTPSGAAIINYRWNFGDGTLSGRLTTAVADDRHTHTTRTGSYDRDPDRH